MSTFTGTDNSDNFVGGSGNDTFDMTTYVGGADTLSGGGGTDTLNIDYSTGDGTDIYQPHQIEANNGSFTGTLYGEVWEWTRFDNIEKINALFSDKDDLVEVDAGPLATVNHELTLNGGGGLDTLSLKLTAFAATSFIVDGMGNIADNIPRLSLSHFENYKLILGDGPNTVSLGSGDDAVYGGASGTVDGGGGNDTIGADVGGNDLLQGGAGDDVLFSNDNDTVDGGSGADIWSSTASASGETFTFEQATGSGSQSGGAAASNVEVAVLGGGAGDDNFVIERTAPTRPNISYYTGFGYGAFGGGGHNTLDISYAGTLGFPVNHSIYTVSSWFDGSLGIYTDGFIETRFQQIQSLKIAFGNDNDYAHVRADALDFGSALDLDGGGGSDAIALDIGRHNAATTFTATAGGSVVTNVAGLSLGGFETYYLSLGNGGNTVVLMGGGYDRILSGSGNDTLDGGSGGDNINAGAGDDQIISSAGADTVDGGDGVDTWIADYAAANAALTLSYDGTTGAGALSGTPVKGASKFTHIERVNLVTGSGGDNITLNHAAVDQQQTLDGGSGADTLTVNDAGAGGYVATTIRGDASGAYGVVDGVVNFTHIETLNLTLGDNGTKAYVLGSALASGAKINLDGGAGADTLIIDLSPLSGTSFNATTPNVVTTAPGLVIKNFETYVVTLGGGSNVVLLASGNDQVTGGAGDDSIFGGSGADTLSGAGGADTVEGGVGTDKLDGGTGVDVVSYEHATAGVNVDLTVAAAQNTGGAGIDTLSSFENILGSGFNDVLRAGSGDHTIQAGGGNDLVYADAGTNVLYDGGGGSGDTVSFGFATHFVTVSLAVTAPQSTGTGVKTILNFENLVGSTYGDNLAGDGGVNVLTGGGGGDTLSGGAGADTFRYLQAADSIVATPDLIKDFQHGIDKVDLTAVRTGAADTYAISTVGANTQLDVDLHGDGVIDLRIRLVGQGVLTAGDLIW